MKPAGQARLYWKLGHIGPASQAGQLLKLGHIWPAGQARLYWKLRHIWWLVKVRLLGTGLRPLEYRAARRTIRFRAQWSARHGVA